MHGPIVVGTDGSSTANLAVDRAVELAKAFGQVLHVVSAHRPVVADATGPITVGVAEEAVRAIAAEAAQRAAAAGVEAVPHGLLGDPASVLLDLAEQEGADLIVVGSKGIGSLKRFVLGNVPAKVVHHAPCSVQVVHTG